MLYRVKCFGEAVLLVQ